MAFPKRIFIAFTQYNIDLTLWEKIASSNAHANDATVTRQISLHVFAFRVHSISTTHDFRGHPPSIEDVWSGRGFGEKNLRRLVQFAEQFPDEQIVAALLRQLGPARGILDWKPGPESQDSPYPFS